MSDWLDQAACKGRSIDWWYPERGDRFAGEVAIVVCRRCPVRSQCLSSALAEEADTEGPCYGIRGGLRPEQRRRLLRVAG